MRSRALTGWSTTADNPSVRTAFVVTISDQDKFEVRFATNTDFENETDGDWKLRPGLKTDLDGLTVEVDPRQQGAPMPSIPEIKIDAAAMRELFGGSFLKNPGALKIEISLISEKIAWANRIVIVSGVYINPNSVYYSDGAMSFGVMDPLDRGKVLLPRKLIDASKLPWTADYLQQNVTGMPFPICYGSVYRSAPIKAYDDGGAGNADQTQPIRRYILCGHQCSGSSATVHRTSAEVAAQFGGGWADISETILTAKTTDGVVFSYIETDGATGDEDPTATPPKECHAISFGATSGVKATAGGVIRDLLERWTDIEFDETLARGVSLVVEALGSPVSVIINGEGRDRASIKELIDQRFATQFRLLTARFGGSMFLFPLNKIMNEPGVGYMKPAAVLPLGGECHVRGEIRESADIGNYFEARYAQRESGGFDGLVTLGPDSDFGCERSRSYYGRREWSSIELPDVAVGATAGAILSYLRGVALEPWYETEIFAPLNYSYLSAALKVRLLYADEKKIADNCPRFRHNLDHDTSEEWRDALITKIRYTKAGLWLSVAF